MAVRRWGIGAPRQGTDRPRLRVGRPFLCPHLARRHAYPVFQFLPVENRVHASQQADYDAINACSARVSQKAWASARDDSPSNPKLKPKRKDALVLSIETMFRLTGGIDASNTERVIAGLHKSTFITVDAAGKVTYQTP